MSLGLGGWVLLPSPGLVQYTQMQVSHHHLGQSDSVLAREQEAMGCCLSDGTGEEGRHVLGPPPPPGPPTPNSKTKRVMGGA